MGPVIEKLRMVKIDGRNRAHPPQRAHEFARRSQSRAIHPRRRARNPEIAAELEYRMRRLGARRRAFETIVAIGARSALPHAQPTGAEARQTMNYY